MLDSKQTDSRRLFILSLGQLVQPKMGKTFKAFVDELMKEKKIYYCTAFIRVGVAYLLDIFYYKTIESYKSNKIDTEKFRVEIKKQLGFTSLSNPQFDNAWNAMCVIDKHVIKHIELLFNAARNNDFTVALPSITTKLHYDYIEKKLAATEGCRLDASNPNIKTFLSYEYKTAKFSVLAKQAIESCGKDYQNLRVTSLHNSVKSLPSGLEVKPIFTYKNTSTLEDIFKVVRGYYPVASGSPMQTMQRDIESQPPDFYVHCF
jgi:hypothetical protein